MIVTLTAHPSLDRAIELDTALQAGGVQSASSGREDAGGKGVNVARVIAAAGVPVRAVLPLAEDDPFRAPLHSTGLDALTVPVAGRVRTNLTLVDPAGVTTKINLPGAALDPAERDAIVAAVVVASEGARWLVLAGSLPPGVPSDFYVRVIEAVRSGLGTGAPRIAVDTSGDALARTVAEGHPDLIKPNDDELAELVGEPLAGGDRVADSVRLARSIVPSRAAAALVTLGSAGAVLVTADAAWAAPTPRIRVRSTVGAGDSSLAGYLLAETAGASAEDSLRHAIRYGAAAASLPGTQAPAPTDLPGDDLPVATF